MTFNAEVFKAEVYCDALGIEGHPIELLVGWEYESPDESVGFNGGFNIDYYADINEPIGKLSHKKLRGVIELTYDEQAQIQEAIEKIVKERSDEMKADQEIEAVRDRGEIA